MIKPISVKALEKYHIWIEYEDGLNGELDLSSLLGLKVFEQFYDKEFFSQVHIDEETHAITWSEQVDICPVSAYKDILNAQRFRA